jgi:hypothetical protein
MYNHLPNSLKAEIPEMMLTDTQLGVVVKDYYRDNSFSRDNDGNINLWRLYNLLTSANKSSYIDNYLERSINAFDFTEQIKNALNEGGQNWYLN